MIVTPATSQNWNPLKTNDCWNLVNSHSGILFNWLFCQVPLSRFSSPLCEIAKSTLLFGYISQWTLPVCQLHCAKFLKYTLPNSEIQVANSTSPWRWTAWMSLKLPTDFPILDCPRPEFFWSAENFCPWLLKKRFPMSCIYLHTPRPLPFLLSLLNLFLLDSSLKLEWSPFKLQTIL